MAYLYFLKPQTCLALSLLALLPGIGQSAQAQSTSPESPPVSSPYEPPPPPPAYWPGPYYGPPPYTPPRPAKFRRKVCRVDGGCRAVYIRKIPSEALTCEQAGGVPVFLDLGPDVSPRFARCDRPRPRMNNDHP